MTMLVSCQFLLQFHNCLVGMSRISICVPEHDAAGIYKAIAAQQNSHTAKLVLLLAVVVLYCLVGRYIITIHSCTRMECISDLPSRNIANNDHQYSRQRCCCCCFIVVASYYYILFGWQEYDKHAPQEGQDAHYHSDDVTSSRQVVQIIMQQHIHSSSSCSFSIVVWLVGI